MSLQIITVSSDDLTALISATMPNSAVFWYELVPDRYTENLYTTADSTFIEYSGCPDTIFYRGLTANCPTSAITLTATNFGAGNIIIGASVSAITSYPISATDLANIVIYTPYQNTIIVNSFNPISKVIDLSAAFLSGSNTVEISPSYNVNWEINYDDNGYTSFPLPPNIIASPTQLTGNFISLTSSDLSPQTYYIKYTIEPNSQLRVSPITVFTVNSNLKLNADTTSTDVTATATKDGATLGNDISAFWYSTFENDAQFFASGTSSYTPGTLSGAGDVSVMTLSAVNLTRTYDLCIKTTTNETACVLFRPYQNISLASELSSINEFVTNNINTSIYDARVIGVTNGVPHNINPSRFIRWRWDHWNITAAKNNNAIYFSNSINPLSEAEQLQFSIVNPTVSAISEVTTETYTISVDILSATDLSSIITTDTITLTSKDYVDSTAFVPVLQVGYEQPNDIIYRPLDPVYYNTAFRLSIHPFTTLPADSYGQFTLNWGGVEKAAGAFNNGQISGTASFVVYENIHNTTTTASLDITAYTPSNPEAQIKSDTTLVTFLSAPDASQLIIYPQYKWSNNSWVKVVDNFNLVVSSLPAPPSAYGLCRSENFLLSTYNYPEATEYYWSVEGQTPKTTINNKLLYRVKSPGVNSSYHDVTAAIYTTDVPANVPLIYFDQPERSYFPNIYSTSWGTDTENRKAIFFETIKSENINSVITGPDGIFYAPNKLTIDIETYANSNIGPFLPVLNSLVFDISSRYWISTRQINVDNNTTTKSEIEILVSTIGDQELSIPKFESTPISFVVTPLYGYTPYAHPVYNDWCFTPITGSSFSSEVTAYPVEPYYYNPNKYITTGTYVEFENLVPIVPTTEYFNWTSITSVNISSYDSFIEQYNNPGFYDLSIDHYHGVTVGGEIIELNTWEQKQKIIDVELHAYYFPDVIDINGNYMVVHDSNNNQEIYVYEKTSSGTWGNLFIITETILTSPVSHCAIWGDYLIIGYPYHNSWNGAIAVYKRTGPGNIWGERFVINGVTSIGNLGYICCIYEDYITSFENEGSVSKLVVYRRTGPGNIWGDRFELLLSEKLRSASPYNMDINDKYIVAGNNSQSKVYVFRRPGSNNNWILSQEILDPTNGAIEFNDVAQIDNDIMLIAGQGRGTNIGRGFIYKRSSLDQWNLQYTLFSGNPDAGSFGESGTIANGHAAISDYGYDNDSGVVYVYKDGALIQTIYGTTNQYFGYEMIAMDGCNLAISADEDDNENGEDAGAIFMFERSCLEEKITPKPSTKDFTSIIRVYDEYGKYDPGVTRIAGIKSTIDKLPYECGIPINEWLTHDTINAAFKKIYDNLEYLIDKSKLYDYPPSEYVGWLGTLTMPDLTTRFRWSVNLPGIGQGYNQPQNAISDRFTSLKDCVTRDGLFYVSNTTEIMILSSNFFADEITTRSIQDVNTSFTNIQTIALDTSDRIYVLDHDIISVLSYDFNLDNWQVLFTWGGLGSKQSKNKYKNPKDLFVSSDDFVYIADTDNLCIKKYSRTGSWIATIESSMFTIDNKPISICVTKSNQLYVLGSDGTIVIFDENNIEINSFKITYKSEYRRIRPSNIDGFLYVVTKDNIVKLAEDGDPQLEFKPFNLDSNYIQNNYSLYQDEYNNIFVCNPTHILKYYDEINIISLLKDGVENGLWSFDDIKIKKDEYVQDWVFNKSINRLWDNIEAVRRGILGKYSYKAIKSTETKTRDFKSSPVEGLNPCFYDWWPIEEFTEVTTTETCYIVPSIRTFLPNEYKTPIYAKNDVFIGINELVTADVINRVLCQLNDNMASIFDMLKESPDKKEELCADVSEPTVSIINNFTPSVTACYPDFYVPLTSGGQGGGSPGTPTIPCFYTLDFTQIHSNVCAGNTRTYQANVISTRKCLDNIEFYRWYLNDDLQQTSTTNEQCPITFLTTGNQNLKFEIETIDGVKYSKTTIVNVKNCIYGELIAHPLEVCTDQGEQVTLAYTIHNIYKQLNDVEWYAEGTTYNNLKEASYIPPTTPITETFNWLYTPPGEYTTLCGSCNKDLDGTATDIYNSTPDEVCSVNLPADDGYVDITGFVSTIKVTDLVLTFCDESWQDSNDINYPSYCKLNGKARESWVTDVNKFNERIIDRGFLPNNFFHFNMPNKAGDNPHKNRTIPTDAGTDNIPVCPIPAENLFGSQNYSDNDVPRSNTDGQNQAHPAGATDEDLYNYIKDKIEGHFGFENPEDVWDYLSQEKRRIYLISDISGSMNVYTVQTAFSLLFQFLESKNVSYIWLTAGRLPAGGQTPSWERWIKWITDAVDFKIDNASEYNFLSSYPTNFTGLPDPIQSKIVFKYNGTLIETVQDTDFQFTFNKPAGAGTLTAEIYSGTFDASHQITISCPQSRTFTATVEATFEDGQQLSDSVVIKAKNCTPTYPLV